MFEQRGNGTTIFSLNQGHLEQCSHNSPRSTEWRHCPKDKNDSVRALFIDQSH